MQQVFFEMSIYFKDSQCLKADLLMLMIGDEIFTVCKFLQNIKAHFSIESTLGGMKISGPSNLQFWKIPVSKY